MTLLAIQIQLNIRIAVIWLPLQISAHATTAKMSCHVQHFVALIVLESSWEQNAISIEFELR